MNPRKKLLATLFGAVALLAAAAEAHADPSVFHALNYGGTNLQQGVAPVNEGSGMGAIVLYQGGGLLNHRSPYGGEVNWGATTMPTSPAVGSKGVAAAYNETHQILHVFVVGQNGIYYARSYDGGGTWDAWYTLDTRTDLSAGVVAVSSGESLVVMAQTNSQGLVAWSADGTGGGFSLPATNLGSSTIFPVATAMGAEGRYDVFGRALDNNVVHWTTLNGGASWAPAQEQFSSGGVSHSYYVAGGMHDLSAISPGLGSLDLFFRSANGQLRHLYMRTYRTTTSWVEEPSGNFTGDVFDAVFLAPTRTIDPFVTLFSCTNAVGGVDAFCTGDSWNGVTWETGAPFGSTDKAIELKTLRVGTGTSTRVELFLVDSYYGALWTVEE